MESSCVGCVQDSDAAWTELRPPNPPVILAVSTTVPNPLQAIAALHSRTLQFPPWVDTNVLRYILIVHPRNSDFSDEE